MAGHPNKRSPFVVLPVQSNEWKAVTREPVRFSVYGPRQPGISGHTASLLTNRTIHTVALLHPSNIFRKTPMRVPFSNAAATLSLSPSCRLTDSAVLCVPSLILTSTRNLGGRACSSLTRTPRPITVAREQCVIVGVMRTVSVVSGDDEPCSGNVGVRKISGRLTTESEPRVRGCSGSEMLEIRSVRARSASYA